jgi:putative transposase
MNEYLQQYSENHSIRLITAYVNVDHVHMLIDLDPTHSIASVVKLLKGASSRWLNQQDSHKTKFSWGRGYGAFSVSQSNVRKVFKYIANQEEHHRERSFTEEFTDFWHKYNVEEQNR